jgi:tetratricopeptide (TPR) repeat protein
MATTERETADAAFWDEVEEASELLQEGRFADALLELREVLRKSPRNPYAYHLLGTAFYETAQHEPARDAFRAAIRLAPDYLGARVSLAHVLRVLGDSRGALVEANDALRRFPKDGEAIYAAGLAYAAIGQRKTAKAYLARYLESNPEFEVATEVRSMIEMLALGEEGDPFEPG